MIQYYTQYPHTRLKPVSSTRELVQQEPIIFDQLRAPQCLKDRIQGVSQLANSSQNIADQAPEKIRSNFTSRHEPETHGVVPLEQCRGIEHAARQIIDVDAHERIRLACVTANPSQVGIFQKRRSGVEDKRCDTVVVADGAAIPLRITSVEVKTIAAALHSHYLESSHFPNPIGSSPCFQSHLQMTSTSPHRDSPPGAPQCD
jgi:hypothetical protein